MFSAMRRTTTAQTRSQCSLRASRRGHFSAEYALLATLMAFATVAAVSLTGTSMSEVMNSINDALAPPHSNSRSGLGDQSNPGEGIGQGNSPNTGTDNPNKAAGRNGGVDWFH